MSDTPDGPTESFDASDPLQVNLARKKAGRKKSDRLEVVRAIMGLVEGRKWVNEWLVQTYIHGNPVVAGDPFMTHFNIGQQNVGKMMLSDVIEAAPADYVKMLAEAKAAEGR